MKKIVIKNLLSLGLIMSLYLVEFNTYSQDLELDTITATETEPEAPINEIKDNELKENESIDNDESSIALKDDLTTSPSSSTKLQRAKENITQTSKAAAQQLLTKGKAASKQLFNLAQNINVKEAATILRNSILHIQALVNAFKASNINLKKLTKENSKKLTCLLQKNPTSECLQICPNKQECAIAIYKESELALELILKHLVGTAITPAGKSTPQLSPAALTAFPLSLNKNYALRKQLETLASYIGLGVIKIKDILESLTIALKPYSKDEMPIELPLLELDEEDLLNLTIDETSNIELDELYEQGITAEDSDLEESL